MTVISESVAQMVGKGAIEEPYRQIEVMTTSTFSALLNECGIKISWEAIHYLWQLGVVRPIAVLSPAISSIANSGERFIKMESNGPATIFLDLGVELSDGVLEMNAREQPSDDLADTLLWHPFQLWQFSKLNDLIQEKYTLNYYIFSGESSLGYEPTPLNKKLAGFINNALQNEFARVLALLLFAEPLIHTFLDTTVTFHPRHGESYEGFFEWQNSKDGTEEMTALGISVSDVARWHNLLAREAMHQDPLKFWRDMVRHTSRDRRLMLNDIPLLATHIIEAAEVLRRYMEKYHADQLLTNNLVLQEEYRVGFIPPPAGADQTNNFIYGSTRLSDHNRGVIRRIVRQYGLDPEPRLTWFVEGDTEVYFLQRYAALRRIDLEQAGIVIENLEGLGNVKPDNFRPVLEGLKRQERFVCVCIDYDNKPENFGYLKQFSKEKLITTEFRYWRPDFVSVNFTPAEVARAAIENATPQPAPRHLQPRITLSGKTISEFMQQKRLTIEVALNALLGMQGYELRKGKPMGDALAKLAFEYRCPKQIAKSNETRPIVYLFDKLLTAPTSNYLISLKTGKINRFGRRESIEL